MTENSKKKKIIIGSIVAIAFFVSALAIGITINIKNEKEAQEVAKLEQEKKEKEAQELKEQQEQEEKERQERLAKYETEWSLLEDGQQYLSLGSDYLKRVEKHENGLYSYKITEEFVGTLYSIVDGFYNGATMEDLSVILNGALVSLPDNATGKEVYDAFVNYADTVNRSEVVSGEGTNPMDVLTPTNQQNNSSTGNNNSSSNGGGTGTSGGGNGTGGSNTSGGGGSSTDNGGSSTSPSNSSSPDDEDQDMGDIFAGNDTYGPGSGYEMTEDDFVDIDGNIMSGGN